MLEIMVVANYALDRPKLREWIVARDRIGIVRFRVVVPIHVVAPVDFAGGLAGFFPSHLPVPGDLVQDAEARLELLLRELRLCGVDAVGSVHMGEPIRVVAAVMTSAAIGEIAVAPAANVLSRFLGVDLARRIRRRWMVPVQEVDVKQLVAA